MQHVYLSLICRHVRTHFKALFEELEVQIQLDESVLIYSQQIYPTAVFGCVT